MSGFDFKEMDESERALLLEASFDLRFVGQTLHSDFRDANARADLRVTMTFTAAVFTAAN